MLLSPIKSPVKVGDQVSAKMYNFSREDETSGLSKVKYPYFEPNWHSRSNIIQIQVKISWQVGWGLGPGVTSL